MSQPITINQIWGANKKHCWLLKWFLGPVETDQSKYYPFEFPVFPCKDVFNWKSIAFQHLLKFSCPKMFSIGRPIAFEDILVILITIVLPNIKKSNVCCFMFSFWGHWSIEYLPFQISSFPLLICFQLEVDCSWRHFDNPHNYSTDSH